MPTITIITNSKKRMQLWVCVCICARNVQWMHVNAKRTKLKYILHCIRLQSNVRQFRSISRNLNSSNLKVNAIALPNDCRCCCCYYSYCIWNDVPQNITIIVRIQQFDKPTVRLSERDTHSFCVRLFLSYFYISFWIKEQTVNTIYYRWLGAMHVKK